MVVLEKFYFCNRLIDRARNKTFHNILCNDCLFLLPGVGGIAGELWAIVSAGPGTDTDPGPGWVRSADRTIVAGHQSVKWPQHRQCHPQHNQWKYAFKVTPYNSYINWQLIKPRVKSKDQIDCDLWDVNCREKFK